MGSHTPRGRRAGTPRFGVAASAGAVLAGFALISGCSTVVDGMPRQNDADASEYAAEATSSSAAASSSKAAADAQAVVNDACSEFYERSNTAVDQYNLFIDAANGDAPDTDAKASEAAGALRSAADVAGGQAAKVPPELARLFTDYANTYRDLAGAVDGGQTGDALNDLAHRGDDIKDAIGAECP